MSWASLLQANQIPRELNEASLCRCDNKGTLSDWRINALAGFISQWQSGFQRGVEGLRLGYQGATAYLNGSQRQAVVGMAAQKNYWQLRTSAISGGHLRNVFKSKQSYYDLFKQAGISWRKRNSQSKDPELVKKNRKSLCLVGSTPGWDWRATSVFLLDECHLLWAMFVDISGEDWPTYWGSLNERVRQTYFGALTIAL